MKFYNNLRHDSKFKLREINVLSMILKFFWKKSIIKKDSKALSKIILKPLVEKLKSFKIHNKNIISLYSLNGI